VTRTGEGGAYHGDRRVIDDLKVVAPASPGGRRHLLFCAPRRIVLARRADEVLPALREADAAAAAGLYAAGYVSYEAAPGFDSALKTGEPGELPLVCLGLYESPTPISLPERAAESYTLGRWRPAVDEAAYRGGIGKIKEYLKSGDTYQVNYTLRLKANFRGDPWALFLKLQRAQRAPCSAFVESDRFALCSASPELFFYLAGDALESRPMKGTAKRGLWFEQDEQRIAELRGSAKNRAENVMIVDMVRNDMGRIARPGTVRAAALFEVERYPTVLQMTSRVTCRTDAAFADLMRALFPCASITGAPKVRTMEIIRELERSPRGAYTGAIGYLAPDRHSLFNVAIRTVAVDKAAGTAEYGVGGGVVWDSDAGEEYEECMTKAAVLTAEQPEFDLLETMLWQPGEGFFLFEEHLERLRHSSLYFGFVTDIAAVRRSLAALASEFCGCCRRVRLTVSRDGGFKISYDEMEIGGDVPACARRVAPALEPVDSKDPFLYHKTTHRAVYERAGSRTPGVDDVLLWNAGGEITESRIANVVIEKNGRRLTPPVECGLLPGVFRGRLLASGEIEEAVITLDDLYRADRVYLINSVRKWMPAELMQDSKRGIRE